MLFSLQAHATCYRQLPSECSFGCLRDILLPPFCIAVPRIDVPQEMLFRFPRKPGTSYVRWSLLLTLYELVHSVFFWFPVLIRCVCCQIYVHESITKLHHLVGFSSQYHSSEASSLLYRACIGVHTSLPQEIIVQIQIPCNCCIQPAWYSRIRSQPNSAGLV